MDVMEVKKEELKKVIDILKDACILTREYTGKVTLHITQGTISGIQLDQMIRPR